MREAILNAPKMKIKETDIFVDFDRLVNDGIIKLGGRYRDQRYGFVVKQPLMVMELPCAAAGGT